jgi:hypothetical protein
MHKYLIEVRDIKTDDTALIQTSAESLEEAAESIDSTQWEVLRVRAPWGGKREGAGRVSKWGDGVKTDRYRLPIALGTNAEEIVSSIEALKTVLEVWEAKVDDSKHRSNGKTAERYKYVEQMAVELRQCLKDLPDSLV